MIRTTLLATMFASLLSVGAFAQAADVGPRLLNDGEQPHVVYSAPSQNIVGRADAAVSGGAADQTEYVTRHVYQTQRQASGYAFGVRQPWQLNVDSHS